VLEPLVPRRACLYIYICACVSVRAWMLSRER
jgi:hypothetical protein